MIAKVGFIAATVSGGAKVWVLIPVVDLLAREIRVALKSKCVGRGNPKPLLRLCLVAFNGHRRWFVSKECW